MDDAAELARLEACAEEAYARMDAALHPTAAAGHYSDVKAYFAGAIGLAQRLGRTDDARRLAARRDHVVAVFRSQY